MLVVDAGADAGPGVTFSVAVEVAERVGRDGRFLVLDVGIGGGGSGPVAGEFGTETAVAECEWMAGAAANVEEDDPDVL
jgi:hypothetical protein